LHIAPSSVHRWFYRAAMSDLFKCRVQIVRKAILAVALRRVRPPVEIASPPLPEQVGICFVMQHLAIPRVALRVLPLQNP